MGKRILGSVPVRWGSVGLVAFLALGVGCSSAPNLKAWRAGVADSRPPSERGSLEEDQARITDLRQTGDLSAARRLALALAAEQPYDATTLFLASRAESDGVFLYPSEDRESRDLAAASALELAERADEAGATGADALAQLAWATGTTTHLQPMFSRAGHARKTLERVDAALAANPDQLTALATKATLRLRLATLPWIARVMAFGAPEGSVDEAIQLAERCVELEPSLEHQVLRARALHAAGQTIDARLALIQALEQPHRYPRDIALRPLAAALLEELDLALAQR